VTDETAAQSPAVLDFRAAMNEVRSNIEVRRLMLVISQILVPALAMAMTDAMTGRHYPESIAWLPEHIFPLVGAVLVAAGAITTGVLTRCHFGLVVNGNKMRRVISGATDPQPLNWLGVTTNFTALTALSAGAGLSLLIVSFGSWLPAVIAGPVFGTLLLALLPLQHWRANRLSRELEANWQYGAVPVALQEAHARMSLEDATSDIAVVVTMGAALFAGTFNAMTNIGDISPDLDLGLPIDAVQQWGLVALSAYTLVSLLLSGRIVIRLRIALGDHSLTLAKLREEPDEPYRFSARERTFLLFLLQHTLACVCALVLVWTLTGPRVAVVAAGALMLFGIGWYPVRLTRARRTDQRIPNRSQ
jgi:Flp pilus assembly protein TadB